MSRIVMREAAPVRCVLACLSLALLACRSSSPAQSADAGDEGDAGPSWLGDAGLVTRPPVPSPLHAICGLAADLPTGDDADSIARRKASFDAALDLGGVLLRRDFTWSDIEPSRGASDFRGYDRVVDDAAARGVRLLGILDYGVKWANAQAQDDQYPPTDPEDFARFAAAAAERYKGKVAAWEVWNEPNNGLRFWKDTLSGDPAAYGALLAATHRAVRAVDPETPLLLGGTVFTPQLIEGAIPFLEDAYAAHPDLASQFDIAGIHAYSLYPPTAAPETGAGMDPPLEAKIQMHAWLLAQHGGDDKPIWITEIGWPVYDVVDEATQARFLVRATILAAHAGASQIVWYDLKDGPHPETFPPEDAFGLLHGDGSPKIAYRALKALLSRVGERFATTDDAKLIGLPADGHAVVFRGASGGPRLVALWTVETRGATVTLDAAGDVYDALGAPMGQVARAGSIAISPDVTYVEIP